MTSATRIPSAEQSAGGVRPELVAAEAARRIRQHPETHDQEHLLTVRPNHGAPNGRRHRPWRELDVLRGAVEEWAECGTTGCAASHAVAAALETDPAFPVRGNHYVDIQEAATRALNLPSPLEEVLFNPGTSRSEVLKILDELARPGAERTGQ